MVDYHIIILSTVFLTKMFPESICSILNKHLSCTSKSQSDDRTKLIMLLFYYNTLSESYI